MNNIGASQFFGSDWADVTNTNNNSSMNFLREFRELQNLVLNRYHYRGKTPLNFDYIEQVNIYDGWCAVYDHPNLGMMALRAVGTDSARDIYGFPLTLTLRTYLGAKQWRVPYHSERLFMIRDYPAMMPIGNAYTFLPQIVGIVNYASELGNIRDAIKSQVDLQKNTVLLKGDKKQVNDLRAAFANIQNGVPIFADANSNLQDSIEAISLVNPASFMVDQLRDEYFSAKERFLSSIGFSVLGADEKKERMITAEAQNGVDAIIAQDIFSNINRHDFVDWYNDRIKKRHPGEEFQIDLIKANDYPYMLDAQRDQAGGNSADAARPDAMLPTGGEAGDPTPLPGDNPDSQNSPTPDGSEKDGENPDKEAK